MNPILVDGATGSCELPRYIVPKAPVRLMKSNELPTDVVFRGYGPSGSMEYGFEYKKISDVLACINNGRFADQLQKLRQFDFAGLIVQGIYRRGSDEHGGQLEIWGSPLGRQKGWYNTAEYGWGKRIWGYADIEHWLFTMTVKAGLWMPPVPPPDSYAAGRLIGSMWRWANDKAWAEHVADQAMNKSHIAPLRGDLPLIVRALSEVEAIGPKWVLDAERYFGSLHSAVHGCNCRHCQEAVLRNIGRWAAMTHTTRKTGRKQRFGKKRALAAIVEIRGETVRGGTAGKK